MWVSEGKREREGREEMIVWYVNMYIEYTLFIAAPHVRYNSPREREGKNRRVRETKAWGMRSRDPARSKPRERLRMWREI